MTKSGPTLRDAAHVADPVAPSGSHDHVPTIKGISGPYRLFFYSLDRDEPPHVHVRRERATCEFWLDPLALAASSGFPLPELSRIRRIIFEHRIRIREACHEHCGEGR